MKRKPVNSHPILEIKTLVEGGEMTLAQIAKALGKKPVELRDELFRLTVTGKLEKTPGQHCATFNLPNYAAQLSQEDHHVL